jgi:rfaE bifunctional protein kinase chain/domain
LLVLVRVPLPQAGVLLNLISVARAEDLLIRARAVRILVVGDLMLDRYLTGSVARISPEAPVPVVLVDRESWALGGAGNVAANVLALGAACEVVGCIGEDYEGGLVRDKLSEVGAGTAGVLAAKDRPTTVKTRIMARRQHVTRFDREVSSDISPTQAEELLGVVSHLAPSAHGLVLQDYNKGVLVPPLIRASLHAAAHLSVPTVVDPKRRRFFEFGGATVFKPNARELEDALGDALQPDDPAWMERVRERLGCGSLLLTLGEHGMAVQSGEAGYLRIPTMARDVYDVSGAGDTVTAVMAVILAAGGTVMEAAMLANHAAAEEVGKAGVATVTPDEILVRHEAHIQQERT